MFVLAKYEFTLVREGELGTDCELILVILSSMHGHKPLHNGACYHSAEKDKKKWLEKVQTSLSRLNKTYSTVVAGDFNLPGWNWNDNIIKTSCQQPRLHEKFGDIINDAGLE